MVQFYKHHIADWMDGTRNLSVGAYRVFHVICQLIYQNEGPITLSERHIAGCAEMRVQDCKRHLGELVEKGKIQIRDGLIYNQRCEKELSAITEKRSRSSVGGKQSAARRAAVAGWSPARGSRPAAAAVVSGSHAGDPSLVGKPLENQEAHSSTTSRGRSISSTSSSDSLPVSSSPSHGDEVRGLSDTRTRPIGGMGSVAQADWDEQNPFGREGA